jgi:hypothetical protein
MGEPEASKISKYTLQPAVSGGAAGMVAVTCPVAPAAREKEGLLPL